MHTSSWKYTFLLVSLTLYSQAASTAGFETSVYSASAAGSSFSGQATGVHDISNMFVNPAILTKFNDNQIGVHISYLDLSGALKAGGTAATASALGGQQIDVSGNGNVGHDFTESAAIPMFYALYDYSESMKLGMSVTVPWGLSTKYDDNWIGRYHAIDSEVQSLNLNPIITYQIHENIAIAGGLQIQYFDALLSSAIDFGTLTMMTPNTATDGKATMTADDWALGFNLGLLFSFDNTDVGIGFRSSIQHNLSGTNEFSVPSSLEATVTAGGAFIDTNITAALTTPEKLTLGLLQQINDELNLTVDMSWTRWSRSETLVIQHQNPAQPDDITVLNWRDSYFVGLGLNYDATETWVFRTGIAYETASTKGDYLNPRVPLDDKIFISLGSDHRVTENLTLTWALMRQIFQDAQSTLSENEPSNLFRGNLTTGYEVDLNVFAFSMNYLL